MSRSAIKWWYSKFPESLFRCSNSDLQTYHFYNMTGYNTALNSNVLICCIARDAANIMDYSISRLERLGSMFKNYHIFVYENDSKDITKQELCFWSVNNKNVEVSCENLGAPKYNSIRSISRIKWLSIARNKYLKYAREYCCNNSVDYIIVYDFDIIGGFSYEGIMNSIGFKKEWDVIGSNGLLYREMNGSVERLYYDSWAYRELGRPECPKEEENGKINLLTYNRGETPIKVNSCFGGLAIYKPRFLDENVWYTDEDCDHPTLHNKLVELSYNIYLNPSQIVLYNKHDYMEQR